ncbi:MAG: ABC transporter permease [Synergistaceae bacterium]|nr:ABC transporter permease [Synergistaceae bacterium]
MWRYILRRIVYLVPVFIGISFFVFFMLHMTPGDPAKMILGDTATEESVQELREEMGLNDPFLAQYWRYIKNAVRGNIGKSYITKSSVAHEVSQAFPATVKLALFSIAIAIFVGIPLGIISAIRQYSLMDNIAMGFALIGISMPVFWLGLLLILFFCVKLGWFPASGFDTFRQMILPAVTLSTPSLAIISRISRSSMLEVIRQDYIRTARAKGQVEFRVICNHALSNALIPIVTIVGLQFGALLEGAVVTESVFAVPGIGSLLVEAIKTRDYPMVLGGVLFIGIVFSLVNLAIDVLYAYIDPRIKAQYGGSG